MQLPPWSYSSISAYETCPFKYYASRVSREFPDAQNEASIWGNRVHKAFEYRLTKKTPMPEGMQQWEPVAAVFDNPGGRLLVEHRFALNKRFGKADWAAAWVRGVIDIGILRAKDALAYDWKTGKVKPDSGQLKLSAAAIMHSYPYVESVTTGFIWLKDNTVTQGTYTREDLPGIWEEFLPKVVRFENSYKTNVWEKRPSGLCNGWCSNVKCTFNSKRKTDGHEEESRLEDIPGTVPGRGADPARSE